MRDLRAEVFQATVEVVRARGYRSPKSWVDLDPEGEYDALHRGTAFYEETDAPTTAPQRSPFTVRQVGAVNRDCLEVAEDLARDGPVPAVLNMTSRQTPGGGVFWGAGAQEENLFRRTNLLWSLYQFADFGREYGVPPSTKGHRYPIPRNSGGIYSPPTAVFRSSEATGYAFLEAPFRVAFVTVPAIREPDVVEREGRPWLAPAMADGTRRKIRAILRIAARHAHADLVLSAFGCGAFRNPPHHVARLFREVLEEPEFDGCFRRVVFAIIDDHNARGEGNYVPFVREFGEYP